MKASIVKKRNSIIIQYRINDKQYRIYTGVSVNDINWNKRSKIIIGDSSIDISSNQLIKKYRDEIESFIYDLKRNSLEYNHEDLKDYLSMKLNIKRKKKIEHDLISVFELFIKNKKTVYKPLTIVGYNNTLSHLKNYSKKGTKIPFEKINKEWFEKLTSYLKIKLNHSPNTRGNQVKKIKAVLKYAYELELHDNTKFQSIKKDKETSINIFLSEQEIDTMLKTNYDDNEQKIIDAFVFMCFTGLRYSDYSKITKSNFKEINNYTHLTFKQSKTNKEVTVPIIYKKAHDLLVKYNFELPKYVNVYLNRQIKEILKKHNLFNEVITLSNEQKKGRYSKYELITIHTARRSFATNQYLKNTPINLIMAATGHATENAFRVYVKANDIEKAKNLINYTDY